MRKFADKLRILRIERKLSVADLSKQVQIGAASISRWENNQADIKSDQLIILAKFFKVSTDFLLGVDT